MTRFTTTFEEPGAVSRANKALIGLACVVTLLVAVAGPRMLWNYAGYVVDYEQFGDYHGHSLATSDVGFWVRNGLAIAFVLWIVASYLPRWSLSRAVRVAVLLPVAHVALLITAWCLWPALSARLPQLATTAPLVDALPMGWVALVAGAACVGLGWLVALKRRGEWVHGAVMLALATLLAVGVWLPIGASLCSGPTTNDHLLENLRNDQLVRSLHDAGPWIAKMLVPPCVVALAFTTVALRRPDMIQRHRQWISLTIYAVFALALVKRFDPTYGAAMLYINFVHVLLGLTSVAVGMLGLLAATLAWRGIRGRRALAKDPLLQHGQIAADADGPVIAYVEITSWLRGPRTWLRPFTVTTRAGAIPIPSGAELVAPLSASTTLLETGDTLAALRSHDRVVIAGLVEPPANHPFRDSGALIPGTNGVFVARSDDSTRRFAGLVLALWRPCVAYFTIAMAIAVLGLVAAVG